MNALVVPTNSPGRLEEFLRAWSPWPWDLIIVVRDGPDADVTVPDDLVAPESRIETYSWREIDASLPDPSIISRQDSAIRSFGFWRAWQAGAEIIFTLDDDCFPADEDFVGKHRANLYQTPGWTSTVDGMRVRGLPYNRHGVLANVQLSMGLWRGIPDLDAITTLSGDLPTGGVGHVSPRVMPAQQFFPMSGMNLALRREIACLMYFPPMGAGQRFARFDDIWCGLLLQRICRHLRYSLVVGPPLIDHRRASDPFVNLVKEAPGVHYNERLWEEIDRIALTATDPRSCMLEAGAWLAASGEDYLEQWGASITSWCGLFEMADEPSELARSSQA